VARASESDPSTVLFCARCAVQLHPGSGDFYQVTIEAVADPSPPADPSAESAAELRRQIEDTLRKLGQISSQEAMDQVYRRLVLHLCGPCFRTWIENPAG
jgi:hypothetical protein